MRYPPPFDLPAETAFALQQALTGRKRGYERAAAKYGISKNKLNDFALGRKVSGRNVMRYRLREVLLDLNIPVPPSLAESPSSPAEQIQKLLDRRELWAKPSSQWAMFIKSPRVFYDLVCRGESSLFSGTDEQSLQNRIAVAIAAHAVLSASSRNRTSFTPAEVKHAYEVGEGAIASLYLDGNPIAAYWYAKLTHMSRDFGNDYFVSDYEVLESNVADRLIERFLKAEKIARQPEQRGMVLPLDNYYLAAQQVGCHVRTLGHKGDYGKTKRLYDKEIVNYPNEIRLPYWRGVWEYVGGRKRLAEHYFNKALAVPDLDAGWGNREIKQLVHCMIEVLFGETIQSEESHDLMRDKYFWIKMRCTVPKVLSRFFDPLRIRMKLPRLASLSLG